MGRKKIQISRILDQRNRQVCLIYLLLWLMALVLEFHRKKLYTVQGKLLLPYGIQHMIILYTYSELII